MSLHPKPLPEGTQVLVEHFATPPAQDRRQAKAWWYLFPTAPVRYKLAFDKFIADRGYTDIITLVAFSGRSWTRTPGR